MKIALLTHSVNPRGGVVHVIELAHALTDAGHDVTVMAPAAPGQAFFRPLRCCVELAPLTVRASGVKQMVAARIDAFVAHLSPRLAAGDAFDIWHAHDGIGGNALATLVERGVISGFVRTVHHLDRFDDTELMSWQQRAVVAAQRVLCVSRLWSDILAQQGIRAIEVNNGVDRQRFRPEPATADAEVAQRLGVRAGAAVVLAVGGIEERKNPLRLLDAFATLRQQQPDTQLLIAGGVSLLDHDSITREFHAALRAQGLHLGLYGDVVLTGAVADADMLALYRRAGVLALPSLREGFGLVVLEALASGTPVVVSNIAPFTEYLDDTLAEWADPLDSASIASALRRALDRGRATQTSPGVQSLCARYSWHASAARHAAIYRESLVEPCHA